MTKSFLVVTEDEAVFKNDATEAAKCFKEEWNWRDTATALGKLEIGDTFRDYDVIVVRLSGVHTA